ncbi:D-alanyl-D-alanine carboxypeptidase family protein [Microbacterium mangrovi]|uniref:D-alanyl-D-alanine carboxypeptidase family protein n=1 Tax=Microbacterium mangrovi TaxID=1348253 RepID=UPI00068E66D1|nr:D-alanyl-D-alanine carboxypeptidase [Microbacterium mangrovi]
MTSADPATVAGPDAAEHGPAGDRLFDDLGATPAPDAVPSLVPRRRRRRAAIWVPIVVVVALLAAYCGTTLFWPIDAIAPKVAAVAVTPVPSDKVTMTWPKHGAGAVSVPSFTGTPASTSAQLSMASITKVVTVLTVLERKPLASGQGPRYRFTAKDRVSYHHYLQRNESALDVPVGGSLTQYQMLQGILIGSASNYADRISKDTFGSNAAFVAAATGLLHKNGITGITIVDPTGFERGNKATPEALMKLAALAMKDSTVAGIVGMHEVHLPGAGTVHNTNGIVTDDGVDGLKTGTLVGYDLLAGKTIQVNGVKVRLFATTLYQPSEAARNAVTRDLFAQLEKQLRVKPSVPRGTTVGEVRTVWGEKVPVVARDDAGVVLWNGDAADVSTSLTLHDQRTKGSVVGSVRATGPLDSAKVDAVLARDVDPPTPWWRLTHPAQLWGITKD